MLIALAAAGAHADEPRKIAQAGKPPSTSDEAFIAERRALASEMSKLVESGASREKIDAWQKENAGRQAAVQEAAIAWSARQRPPELPLTKEVRLPSGASQAVEDFLVSRVQLNNSRAVLLNGLRDATGEQRQQALEAWRTKNAAATEASQQLAETISEEQPRAEMVVPDPAPIRPGASPELKAFLTQCHALMKERAEIFNELRSASPEVRQQALENWNADTSARLQAIREAAARLTK